jgi:hypothetical protein
VARHLHERGLGRRHHAERVADRAALARDLPEEEIGRPGLVPREDGFP